jgi:hypothetical protein
MSVVTISAKDGNGNPVSLGDVDLSYGLTISTIKSALEWDLTTIDDSPNTVITPHIGGTPSDRS